MALNTAGVNRCGSAAVELSWTAAGRVDAMWEVALKPWDVAAAFVIGREAGLKITTLDGRDDPFKEPYEFMAAPEQLHAAMLEEYRRAGEVKV